MNIIDLVLYPLRNVVYTTIMKVSSNPSANAVPIALYTELQRAYEYYNNELFSGSLAYAMITLSTSKENTRGYHRSRAYINSSNNNVICDEIALNPAYWSVQSIQESLSTLVHEMVHLWQEQYGEKKSRSGYHNKEWAEKMRDIGLPPVSQETGDKGLGQCVSHRIAPLGAFSTATKAFLTKDFMFMWEYRYIPLSVIASAANKRKTSVEAPSLANAKLDELLKNGNINGAVDEIASLLECKPCDIINPSKSGVRTKYSCPGCGINVWGASGLHIRCDSCNRPMREV